MQGTTQATVDTEDKGHLGQEHLWSKGTGEGRESLQRNVRDRCSTKGLLLHDDDDDGDDEVFLQ